MQVAREVSADAYAHGATGKGNDQCRFQLAAEALDPTPDLAVQTDPGVDPALFRHFGVKPQAKEMAIVMLSDATEAAARAYSQEEDPSAEGLQRVVDTVVAEKVDDGQLDDSALTFGDLTTIKAELVRALMGYYHARLPYPGFPGPKPMEEASPKGLPEAAVPTASKAEE